MAKRKWGFAALFTAKWLAVGLFLACRHHPDMTADEQSAPNAEARPAAAPEPQQAADLERIFELTEAAVRQRMYHEASAHLSDGILVFRNRTGRFHGQKAASANRAIGQLAAMRNRLRRSQPVGADEFGETARAAIVLVNSQ